MTEAQKKAAKKTAKKAAKKAETPTEKTVDTTGVEIETWADTRFEANEDNAGFPEADPEGMGFPENFQGYPKVIEGVREITQNPAFDPNIDNEEDFE